MNKKDYLSGIVMVVSFFALFLSGCTHIVVPDDIPSLETAEGLVLSGVHVEIINVEQDSAEKMIYESKRMGTFLGTRRLWIQKTIEALKQELKTRGVEVSEGGSVKMSLAMTNLAGRSGGDRVKYTVGISVKTDSGWSNVYHGIASATTWARDAGSAGNRAASYAIRDAISKMFADRDFLAQLRG